MVVAVAFLCVLCLLFLLVVVWRSYETRRIIEEEITRHKVNEALDNLVSSKRSAKKEK